MSETYIPRRLRASVSAQARFRCGYCLTAEWIAGVPMEIEHIIPESLGGLTVEENLWLACSLCNNHKNDTPRSIHNPARLYACLIRALSHGQSISSGTILER